VSPNLYIEGKRSLSEVDDHLVDEVRVSFVWVVKLRHHCGRIRRREKWSRSVDVFATAILVIFPICLSPTYGLAKRGLLVVALTLVQAHHGFS
jgi:hypothetical protein